MKKLAFLFVLVLGISAISRAQYSMDFGLNLGGAHYIGELGDPGITERFFDNPFPLYIEPQSLRYSVGGFYRYNFTRNIAARFEANWVRISGVDSLADSPARRGRNLSFRTDIIEFSLMGEYAFWTKNDISRNSRIDFQADAHIGIGYILYYPHAQLNDEWYSLRPLATEGIENEYDVGSLIVPIGVGFSWTFNKKIRAGMDISYRFTFTDYLDDVSTDYAYAEELPFAESVALANRSDEAFQRGDADLPNRGFYNSGSRRGNPETNDGYFLAMFKVSYVINVSNSFYKARYKSLINRRRKRTKF